MVLNYETANRCIELLNKFRSCQDIGMVIVNNGCDSPMLLEYCQLNNIPTIRSKKSEEDEIEVSRLMLGNANRFVILSSINLGYSGGNNLALRPLSRCLHQGKFLVMNPDIELSSVTARSLLDRVTEIAGPAIWEDYLQGVRPLQDRFDFATGFEATNRSRDEDVGTILSGCCIAITSNAIRRFGLLPEENFLYDEEPKYFERIHRLGGRPIYYPDLQVRHLGSASIGKKSFRYFYYIFRNRLNYFNDVAKVHYAAIGRFIWNYGDWYLSVLGSNWRERNWEGLRGQWRGLIDGIRGCHGPGGRV